MCGIVGRIASSRASIDKDRLNKACDLLYSRGPDDSGVWHEGCAGFGHRRLSILDLSVAGHQPMHSVCGRYVLVFNGEVYNHMALREQLPIDSWQGHSDSETLLAAYIHWGKACLSRLSGMFAFAIWDRQKQCLFAARDRMGVKPLYYQLTSSGLTFASRPRALLALDHESLPNFSCQGIRYYLQSGYFPADASIYEGVSKLPSAHYLEYADGHLSIGRYWDFRCIAPQPQWKYRRESELLDELDALIQQGVASRMIADVPLGAFLSGGIDSSLVVAMMSRMSSHPVQTFTIGFDEMAYDESSHAEAVASYLGTEHHCQRLRVDDLLSLLPLFGEAYDEPFFDSSAFPTMAVSRLARQHVTVSLSGDGGDELFGGYHYYAIADKLSPFFALPSPLRRSLGAILRQLPSHSLKLVAGALGEKDAAAAFAFARSISKDFDGLLMTDAEETTQDMRELFSQAAQLFPQGLSAGEAGARLDALFTLPDDYLQKVDLGSMAFSLESRDPLLDTSLIEWAMQLPWCWKRRGGVNKYLLRQLAYRYIPREILDRPKQGFGVPIDHWLRGPLSSWAQELLHDRSLFEQLPLHQSRALELFEIHRSGARNVSALLWALLMLLNFISSRSTGHH